MVVAAASVHDRGQLRTEIDRNCPRSWNSRTGIWMAPGLAITSVSGIASGLGREARHASRSARIGLGDQMPGGAAVPRVAMIAPTPSRAGRRVLTGPSSATYGMRCTADGSARTVLVRRYRGKLVRQGDHPPRARPARQDPWLKNSRRRCHLDEDDVEAVWRPGFTRRRSRRR